MIKTLMKRGNPQNKIAIAYALVVFLVLLLTLFTTFQWGVKNTLSYCDTNLENAAYILAHSTDVIQLLENQEENPDLYRYIDNLLIQDNQIDVITICDNDAVRYYHPDKSRLGQTFIGGDESPILKGHDGYFSTAVGTLGRQRRYFIPVRDRNGSQIGFIMASVLTENLELLQRRILSSYAVIGFIAFVLIVIVAAQASFYMQKLLLGFEPDQIARLYLQRQEVMDVLEEGVFAINKKGEIILVNQAAIHILGLTDGCPEGKRIEDIFPATRLHEILETGKPEYNVNMKLNNITLLTSRIPVVEKDRIIGAAAIFRNRTEMTRLAEELTGVNHMVDAMRSYTHEFTNKLHVILGLIQIGRLSEAANYIVNISLVQYPEIRFVINAIENPTVAALLIGKLCRCSELGITMVIDKNSFLRNDRLFLSPGVMVTMIGNLLENSMDSLNQKPGPPKEIMLSLFCDDTYVVITVDDTGTGIPKDHLSHLFECGFSTKGTGRGVGLSLVKELVDSYHGEITMDSEVGNGTSITISIANQPEKGGTCI